MCWYYLCVSKKSGKKTHRPNGYGNIDFIVPCKKIETITTEDVNLIIATLYLGRGVVVLSQPVHVPVVGQHQPLSLELLPQHNGGTLRLHHLDRAAEAGGQRPKLKLAAPALGQAEVTQISNKNTLCSMTCGGD